MKWQQYVTDLPLYVQARPIAMYNDFILETLRLTERVGPFAHILGICLPFPSPTPSYVLHLDQDGIGLYLWYHCGSVGASISLCVSVALSQDPGQYLSVHGYESLGANHACLWAKCL